MKCYLISDNIDTQMGMRLAGINGVVVHKADEVLSALRNAVKDDSIAVIFVTTKLMELCREEISAMKLDLRRPLIAEIPDRHGGSRITESLGKYMNDAVGIKI